MFLELRVQAQQFQRYGLVQRQGVINLRIEILVVAAQRMAEQHDAGLGFLHLRVEPLGDTLGVQQSQQRRGNHRVGRVFQRHAAVGCRRAERTRPSRRFDRVRIAHQVPGIVQPAQWNRFPVLPRLGGQARSQRPDHVMRLGEPGAAHGHVDGQDLGRALFQQPRDGTVHVVSFRIAVGPGIVRRPAVSQGLALRTAGPIDQARPGVVLRVRRHPGRQVHDEAHAQLLSAGVKRLRERTHLRKGNAVEGARPVDPVVLEPILQGLLGPVAEVHEARPDARIPEKALIDGAVVIVREKLCGRVEGPAVRPVLRTAMNNEQHSHHPLAFLCSRRPLEANRNQAGKQSRRSEHGRPSSRAGCRKGHAVAPREALLTPRLMESVGARDGASPEGAV